MAFSFLDIKIGRGAETPLPWSAAILARVVEEISNLCGKRGENSAVEEEIETCENNTADYYTDNDLNASINIAFTGSRLDRGLCGNNRLVKLGLDGINKILHKINTSFFLLIFFRLSLINQHS